VSVYGPYKATVANIHDGDTVDVDVLLAKTGKSKVDVDLGFNIHRTAQGTKLVRQPVRLLGCNAPELATPEGKAALAFIQTVVHIGDVVTFVSHNWDKYGDRVDGTITLADGRDLTAVMITAGHAFAWDGVGVKPTSAQP
jgi:endonuclease YncB( thermonuclease family)